jgi:hypothetical protein
VFDVRLRGRNGYNLGNLVDELKLQRVEHAPLDEPWSLEALATALMLTTNDVKRAKEQADKKDITVRVRSWTSTLKEIRRRAGLQDVVCVKLRKAVEPE